MLGEGESLTAVASKRLKALEEYSELGAGFKIAMRDLEIRGAGNILGTEQSGHISAVGYELYCQLLENAVLKMKDKPLRDVSHVSIDLPLTALFPDDYIPAGRQKIEMYRKLSLVRTHEELADVAGELKDRFGPLPEESQLLIELKSLQVDARVWEIEDIHLEGDRFAVFRYRNATKIQQLSHLVGSDLRIVDRNDCYLLLKCDLTNPRELLGRLKSVLQTNRGLT
jgi:transcription-repair coupling factor (superfamily II helicase)